jgi:hypothetical protein
MDMSYLTRDMTLQTKPAARPKERTMDPDKLADSIFASMQTYVDARTTHLLKTISELSARLAVLEGQGRKLSVREEIARDYAEFPELRKLR